ncbi:MAG: Hsp20/alpha crystallin family protein [Candidatus Sumerlaeaceae bacterium]|nr:Hsp20/alpha crystallin family protein [Candidatus Sumerlaeaceae bacterium]
MTVKDLVSKVKDTVSRKHEVGKPMTTGRDMFAELHREMDRVFDNFLGDLGGTWRMPSLWSRGEGMKAFSPSLDVRDNGKELRVVAELPGMDEKELDVELTGECLTISGQKKEEVEEPTEGWAERRFGSFSRTISLPKGIDPEKVTADFRKGVLTVTLPRRPEAQVERRKITVENGEKTPSPAKKAA